MMASFPTAERFALPLPLPNPPMPVPWPTDPSGIAVPQPAPGTGVAPAPSVTPGISAGSSGTIGGNFAAPFKFPISWTTLGALLLMLLTVNILEGYDKEYAWALVWILLLGVMYWRLNSD
jgi:hypothetical protein